MKLQFTQDAWYNGELFAKAGEVKEVSEEFGFAQRWLKRGAVEVAEEKVKEEIKVEVKEEFSGQVAEDVIVDKPEVKEENKKGKTSKRN